MRRWNVWFAGDPEFGRETVEYATTTYDADPCEAPDASTAARKVIAEWRDRDRDGVREAGWYGDGTAVYVQEALDPPPVLTFVRSNGRMKKERA